MDTRKIAKTLALIVDLLSRRELAKLYNIDSDKSFLPEELLEVIEDYGGNITLPENDHWDYHFYPINNSDKVFINYDLFIDNKPSDLTLQCTMEDDDEKAFYSFSIEAIHML